MTLFTLGSFVGREQSRLCPLPKHRKTRVQASFAQPSLFCQNHSLMQDAHPKRVTPLADAGCSPRKSNCQESMIRSNDEVSFLECLLFSQSSAVCCCLVYFGLVCLLDYYMPKQEFINLTIISESPDDVTCTLQEAQATFRLWLKSLIKSET